MLTVTGLKSCDTCRAARKWLDEQSIAYDFKDVRVDGLNKTAVSRWLKRLGGGVLINKSSTTWRALSDDEKDKADKNPLNLLIENPTLLKRPVFEDEKAGVLEVGFKDPQKAALEKLKA